MVNKVDPVTGEPYPNARTNAGHFQSKRDDGEHSPSHDSFKAPQDTVREANESPNVRYEPHIISGEVREHNGKKEY